LIFAGQAANAGAKLLNYMVFGGDNKKPGICPADECIFKAALQSLLILSS